MSGKKTVKKSADLKKTKDGLKKKKRSLLHRRRKGYHQLSDDPVLEEKQVEDLLPEETLATEQELTQEEINTEGTSLDQQNSGGNEAADDEDIEDEGLKEENVEQEDEPVTGVFHLNPAQNDTEDSDYDPEELAELKLDENSETGGETHDLEGSEIEADQEPEMVEEVEPEPESKPESDLEDEQEQAVKLSPQKQKLRKKIQKIHTFQEKNAQQIKEREELVAQKIKEVMEERDSDAQDDGEDPASKDYDLLDLDEVTLTFAQRLHRGNENMWRLSQIRELHTQHMEQTWRGLLRIQDKQSVLRSRLEAMKKVNEEEGEDIYVSAELGGDDKDDLPPLVTAELEAQPQEESYGAEGLQAHQVTSKSRNNFDELAVLPTPKSKRKQKQEKRQDDKQKAEQREIRALLAELSDMEQEKKDRVESIRPKLRKVERAMQEQKDRLEKDVETMREKQMQDLTDRNGDLGSHAQTGLGPEAKHKSEVNREKKTEFSSSKVLSVFQENVLQKYEANLDQRVNAKRKKLESRYGAEYADALQKELDQQEGSKEEILEDCRLQIEVGEKAQAATSEQINQAWAKFSELEDRKYLLEERVAQMQQELDQATKKYGAELDENGVVVVANSGMAVRKITRMKKKVDKEMEKLGELIDAYVAARVAFEDLKQDRDQQDQMIEITRSMKHAAKIGILEEKRKNAREEVANTDILDLADKNYEDLENRKTGIYLDGKMYVEGASATEAVELTEENADVTGKDLDLEDVRIQAEEQKIVQALKSQPIFKYLNSENIMEYATYDEGLGVFDLQELPETIDPEVLQKQIQALQKQRQENKVTGNMSNELEDFAENGGKDMSQETLRKIALAYQRQQTTENYRSESDTAYEKEQKGDYKHNQKLYFHGSNHLLDAKLKFLMGAGLKAAGSYTGIGSFVKAGEEGYMNGTGAVDSAKGAAIQGAVEMAVPLATVMDMLGNKSGLLSGSSLQMMLPGVEGLHLGPLIGGTTVSPLTGLTAGLAIGKGAVEAALAREDRKRMEEASQTTKSKGQKRSGRILDQASTEKKVDEFAGYVNAVNGAAGMALKFSGVGGLAGMAATAISALTKMIYGAVQRKKQMKAILDSKDVLGGVSYDKKLIDIKHFNILLGNVTGFKDEQHLFNAMRIVDSIDMHRAVQAAAYVNSLKKLMEEDEKSKLDSKLPELDTLMEGLGLGDPESYSRIGLKDLQKKMGYRGNWREDLHHSVEIKGLDYNDAGSRMVTATRRKGYYQEKNQRLTRAEVVRARYQENKKLAEKKRGKEEKAQGKLEADRQKIREKIQNKQEKQKLKALKRSEKAMKKLAPKDETQATTPEKTTEAVDAPEKLVSAVGTENTASAAAQAAKEGAAVTGGQKQKAAASAPVAAAPVEVKKEDPAATRKAEKVEKKTELKKELAEAVIQETQTVQVQLAETPEGQETEHKAETGKAAEDEKNKKDKKRKK